MWETIYDCFLDTLKLFPFLFVLYVLIELLEHKTMMGKPNKALTGGFAPLVGCATGLIPMCGFSVMASKLYERKYLTVGTLFAVFIATSDEAFLVIALSALPAGEKICTILLMCAGKLILGAAVGYALDFVFSKRNVAPAPIDELHEQEDVREHEHELMRTHGHDHEEFQACEHRRSNDLQLYLFSPLLHALQIAAVILLCNLAFGLLFYYVGEENVIEFLRGAGLWYQPLLCCLVGLIPNCASSVALAETFAVGGISFGSCFGGLVTNSGLGVLALFRNTKAVKRNLIVLAAMYLIGVAAGYAVNAIALML